MLLAGCTDSCNRKPPVTAQDNAPAEASPAAAVVSQNAERIPDGPWRDLAIRLVQARDLDTAIALTRDVLARGGIATVDGTQTLVAASAPASALRLSPLETVHVAMEARRRPTASRLTAAELAQLLEGFGFPFPDAREGGGNAAESSSRGQVSPADQQKLRDAELAERKAAGERRRSADDAVEQGVEAEQQQGRARIDAAQQRVTEATAAWQKARQAVNKTPPAQRPAAEAQVKAALDARMAAIEELGRIRNQESEAERERRTRASRARDDSSRLERVERSIGPDYQNGERLMEMLGAWVRNAAAQPGDPRSFTPLFLAEMARLQDPPVDLLGSRFSRLGRGDGAPVDIRSVPRSARLRFTLLELELMAAAFLPMPPRPAAAAPAALPDVALASLALAQDGPCSDLMKSIEQLGKELAGDLGGAAASGAAGEAAGEALDKAIESAVGESSAESFGKVMDAFGVLAKIAKLVSFYGDTQITVTPDPRNIHKPLGSNEYVGFTATAGVNDRDLEEYRKAVEKLSSQDRVMRDCLDAAGMPRLSNLNDLAKEAEEWLVDWDLVEGAPTHAYFSLAPNDFYLPGRRAMKLKRSGEASASAIFVVDILPEEKHTGRIVRAYVTARASVDAAEAPSIGTFLNPITGVLGLVESLVELGVGWFQFMYRPKAYGTVEVEYHCPRPTTYYDDAKPVGDGGGGDGSTDCVIEAER